MPQGILQKRRLKDCKSHRLWMMPRKQGSSKHRRIDAHVNSDCGSLHGACTGLESMPSVHTCLIQSLRQPRHSHLHDVKPESRKYWGTCGPCCPQVSRLGRVPQPSVTTDCSPSFSSGCSFHTFWPQPRHWSCHNCTEVGASPGESQPPESIRTTYFFEKSHSKEQRARTFQHSPGCNPN